MVAYFKAVVNANCRLVAPPPTRRTAIGGYPRVVSYDMLSEQFHYSNPVKHEWHSQLGGPVGTKETDWQRWELQFPILIF